VSAMLAAEVIKNGARPVGAGTGCGASDQASAVGSTSLDQREHDAVSRWVRVPTSQPKCRRFPFDYLDVTTGQVRPGSCKAIRCPVCGPGEVRRRAWRAANAGPERFAVLTALPDEFKAARRHEAVLLKRLRRQGFRVEWAIAHELTKRGQRHANALLKGDYIPQRTLQEAHGSIAHIQVIRSRRGVTSYALKEALRVVRYSTKGVDDLEMHLALNGGRLYRTTRGYFR